MDSLCGEVQVGNPPHKIRICDVHSQTNKEHTWTRVGVEHVLPVIESFHLYDQLGRAVSHNEQPQVDRIPAIMEFCIQDAVDIPEYSTRTSPVYRGLLTLRRGFPKKNIWAKISMQMGSGKRGCLKTITSLWSYILMTYMVCFHLIQEMLAILPFPKMFVLLEMHSIV